MNAKISVFVICVETIIYLSLHNLHDFTFKVFTISSDKLVRKRNTGKDFWRYSSSAHFSPALQYSANLMPET